MTVYGRLITTVVAALFLVLLVMPWAIHSDAQAVSRYPDHVWTVAQMVTKMQNVCMEEANIWNRRPPDARAGLNATCDNWQVDNFLPAGACAAQGTSRRFCFGRYYIRFTDAFGGYVKTWRHFCGNEYRRRFVAPGGSYVDEEVPDTLVCNRTTRRDDPTRRGA